MDQPARIGFIGMGSIGKPMALNLSRSGVPLTLWARRPEVLEDFPVAVQRADTGRGEALRHVGVLPSAGAVLGGGASRYVARYGALLRLADA